MNDVTGCDIFILLYTIRLAHVGTVTIILAWLPSYRHGYHHISMVTIILPWLPSYCHDCHGYHHIVMVTIILPWLPSYCHGYHHGCSSTAPACNWELDRGFSCCTLAVAMTMRHFSHQCCRMKTLACPALIEKQNNERKREGNCQNVSIVII